MVWYGMHWKEGFLDLLLIVGVDRTTLAEKEFIFVLFFQFAKKSHVSNAASDM